MPTDQNNSMEAMKRQREAFRQRAQAERGNGGGGKSDPIKRLRYRNTRHSETPAWMWFHPCTPDEPFFVNYTRWHANGDKRVEVYSNSHNGELDVPDLLYDYAMFKDDTALLGAQKFNITTATLEAYHEVQVPNKNARGNAPKSFTNYERCTGAAMRGRAGCVHCAADRKENRPSKMVFGRGGYSSFSYSQKEALMQAIYDLGNRCASCKTGTLETVGFSCPSCSGQILDCYDTQFSEEDMAGFVETVRTNTVECQHCKEVVQAEEVRECVRVTGQLRSAGCDAPKQLFNYDTPFAYDFLLSAKRPANDKPGPTEYIIHDWREHDHGIELPSDCKSAWPLARFLSYMTLAEQAQKLGWGSSTPDGEQALVDFFDAPRLAPSAAGPNDADAHSTMWADEPAAAEDIPF